MNEVDQGLGYYKRALEVDPLHLPALEALERIYTTRAMNRELVDVLDAQGQGARPTAKPSPPTSCASPASTRRRWATSTRRRRRTARCSTSTRRTSPAMRGLERIYTQKSSWPELVGVLEQQLDVVASERERIELLMKLATIQEEQFLKPDLAALRLEQVVEIDADPRSGATSPSSAATAGSSSGSISSPPTSGTSPRRSSARSRSSSTARWPRSTPTRSRISTAPSTPTATSSTSTTANIPALEALAKLYEKQGDAAQAIEYMTRVADLTADGKQRVEMYYRIGKALDEKLGDRAQAQERYEMALDLDPAHLPTLGALAPDRHRSARTGTARRATSIRSSSTRRRRAQRAKLLVELGKLRDEMLGEHDLGVQAYELALQCDGDNEDAALPLVSEYVAQRAVGEGRAAGRDARQEGRQARARASSTRSTTCSASVASALGKDDKALKAYQAAHQLDLTDQETIRGLADVCFRSKDWAGALTQLPEGADQPRRGRRSRRAPTSTTSSAASSRSRARPSRRSTTSRRRSAVEPTHRPTLEALVDVYTGLKDWKQVCAYKRQILDNVVEGGERFKLLDEIGDIWADKEKNPQKAIEASKRRSSSSRRTTSSCTSCLQLYQATAELAEDDRVAADHRRPGDAPRAQVEVPLHDGAALPRQGRRPRSRGGSSSTRRSISNPSFLEAFERINKILTPQKEWKQLERAFRKMLHRIAGKGNADLEYNLWHNLGLIYRDRLSELNAAIEAFKMAARLKPDEAVERQILAELYETTEQIDARRRRAARDPASATRCGSTRTARSTALLDAQAAVRRRVVHVPALAFLRKADEDEQRSSRTTAPRGCSRSRAGSTTSTGSRTSSTRTRTSTSARSSR